VAFGRCRPRARARRAASAGARRSRRPIVWRAGVGAGAAAGPAMLSCAAPWPSAAAAGAPGARLRVEFGGREAQPAAGLCGSEGGGGRGG
jgi:hypothetical protein